ncbi:MAG: creatininase family protein [Gemmatimonadales bacterium]
MTPEHVDQPKPVLLACLTALAARRVLSSNPRLLIPAGTLIARGPELPLGADTLIVERLAHDLSARLQIACSPVIPFGVHGDRDPDSPGTASLTRKTLHRMMNELIAAWETEAKVDDVVILTAHAADAHLEALSTIRATGRVTLIDIFAAPLPDASTAATTTSILLAIAPESVETSLLPPGLAQTPEAGQRLYGIILDYVLERIERSAETS